MGKMISCRGRINSSRFFWEFWSICGQDLIELLSSVRTQPAITQRTKDEVVRSEQLPERSGPNALHGSWFQVHQHWAGDIFMCCTHRGQKVNWCQTQDYQQHPPMLTGRLVVVDADPVQLQSRVSHVVSCRVDAVLVADHFPELHESQVSERGLASDSRALDFMVHSLTFYADASLPV